MALEAVTQGTVTSNTLEGYRAQGPRSSFTRHRTRDRGCVYAAAHLSPSSPTKQAAPGHILTEFGLKPIGDRVKVVTEMPYMEAGGK